MRRKLGRLGAMVVVATLVAASIADARKPVPPLSMEQLATAWVGGTDGGEYARLEIKADGSGALAVQAVSEKTAKGYRVTRTVLTGYRVNFQVVPAEEDAEPLFLIGRGHLFELELQIGGTSGKWKRDLSLERLSDVTARLDSVSKRIRELEATQ